MKRNRPERVRTAASALLAVVIMTLAVAAGCTPVDSPATTATDTGTPGAATTTGAQVTEPGEDLELTLEELKSYDGKDGRPAYVAVDGIIYDVSKVDAWVNGEHNGNVAGNDLTDVIKNRSPHGISVLGDVPQVGRIKE